MENRETSEKFDSIVNSSPSLLLKIKAEMPQRNPAQKRITDYITSHFDELEGMAISELALASGASEATVSRFVKTLGFASYRDFQTAVVISRHEQPDYKAGRGGYDMAVSGKKADSLIYNVFEANIQSLIDTLAMIDIHAMKDVACRIAAKGSVSIFAQGRSCVTAESIRLRLYRLNIQISVFSDPHEQAVVSSLVKKGDLVMGISTFGRSQSVVANCRRAKEQGAYVIGVSSYKNTPLENTADVLLLSSSSEEKTFGSEPSTSTVSQMVMLDCLFLLVCKELGEETDKNLEITREAIAQERGVQ